MKKTMKRIVVVAMIAVLALSVFALTGCGKSGGGDEKTDWDYIEDKGKIIVGLDDTFAPMGFRDENNEIVGFDIDVANEVCDRLGITNRLLRIIIGTGFSIKDLACYLAGIIPCCVSEFLLAKKG